nr:gustatory receptor 14 [Achelura yunnanensis]
MTIANKTVFRNLAILQTLKIINNNNECQRLPKLYHQHRFSSGRSNLTSYLLFQMSWEKMVMQVNFSTQELFRIALPACFIEMINTRFNDIKDMLHDILITKPDITTETNAKYLLRYMNGRCHNRDIWGVVPVNVRLPFAVFSLCVTYIIVLVQFTHLFD